MVGTTPSMEKSENEDSMYALIKQTGNEKDILYLSYSKSSLSEQMKEEVESDIQELYDPDPDYLATLQPVTDGMDYWTDGDSLSPIVYRIIEVPVIA